MKKIQKIQRKQKGFTLMEMMIIVVIIGILVAFSVNSYREYVISGHKKTVQAKIMEVVSTLERDYTQNSQYRTIFIDGLNADPVVSQYTGNSGFIRYNINITRIDSQRYTIRATPNNIQTEDVCGWLQIDNFGRQTYEHASADISKCW